MAFNAGTVKGTLDLNVQKFKQSIDKATKGMKRLGGSAKTAGGDVKRFGGSMKKTVLGMVALVGGVLAIRKAFNTIVSVVGRASKAQQEYEQSVSSLAAGLVQTGAPSIVKTTEELEKLATVIQDTTRFNDTDVLQVAKALAAFGAEADQLASYTETVLNFSEAFGVNFTTASRAFGQAMAGNSATLARYFPQARELTQEQLKAGEAFNVAGSALKDYAQIAGQSTAGSLARLGNVLNDLQKRLGEAFNQFIGPLAEDLKGIFRDLVDSLGEGSEGFEALVAGMREGFETVLSGVRLLIEGFFQVRIIINQLQVAGALWQQVWVTAITVVIGVYVKLFEVINNIIAGVASFVATIPGLSEGIKQSVQDVSNFFKENAAGAAETLDSMENMRTAAAGVVAERKKEVEAAKATLKAIQANEASESNVLTAVTSIYNLKVKLTREEKAAADLKRQELADQNRIARAVQTQRDATKTRLDHLREVTGIMGPARGDAEATAAATEGIASAAGKAANSVGDMADEFGRAASGASATASAAAGIGGGGAGAGGGAFAGTATLSASRRSGGRSPIDFSDPFRAVAQAQSAQQTLGRIGRGGKNVYVGFSGVNAARAFADGVTQQAQAAVDRALADFTGDIISELNQAGILNPAERSRIIRERISEAERLGVIPASGSLESSAGVMR